MISTPVQSIPFCAGPIPSGISALLEQRSAAGGLRVLSAQGGGVDLCSNDYLGLARSPWPVETLERLRELSRGAGASRLVNGNLSYHEELEGFFAEFYRSEASLVFGSGYEANTALLGALGRRGDTLIYDELAHASMRDGVRLSMARSYSFRHNDVDDLHAKLARASGDRYVIVESVYSMDGDEAPLRELAKVCVEEGAFLVVDEAHATGVFGAEGRGLVCSHGLESAVFARVHTFGKAVGYRGACVAGPKVLAAYLVNYARPFVYTTAVDPVSTLLMREAHERMRRASDERIRLMHLVSATSALASEYPTLKMLPSTTPVQGVVVSGNKHVLAAEQALLTAGFAARAIRAPTVPEGRERIRICLHAFNTEEDISGALSIVAACSGAPA